MTNLKQVAIRNETFIDHDVLTLNSFAIKLNLVYVNYPYVPQILKFVSPPLHVRIFQNQHSVFDIYLPNIRL